MSLLIALRALLIVLSLVGMAHASTIDFTPHFETSREDGVPVRRMYFTSGNAKIIYEPPSECDVRGYGDQVRLVPKDFSEAEARIENTASQMPVELDEEGLKAYRTLAESLLPKHVEVVVPRHEKRDAVPINDWRGFEKAFTYTLAGRRFVRAILFIKLDRMREIRLIVTCREADFETFYPRVFASLNSWLETKS